MPVKGLYCYSEFLGRKIKDVEEFDWSDVNLDAVVGSTKYPLATPNGYWKPQKILSTRR
jgi:hypothetical protein